MAEDIAVGHGQLGVEALVVEFHQPAAQGFEGVEEGSERGLDGPRLEKLGGDRAGQHSIRINDQWRICFRWTKAGPEDVSITDYH